MSALFLLLLLSTSALCNVAYMRPYNPNNQDFDDGIVFPIIVKKASSPVEQSLVMARLQELMGPEIFSEIDSHGRLSNLQRIG